MIRTQIQLDDATYAMVKNKAYAENRSMASVIRDAINEHVVKKSKTGKTLRDLKFVASGRSSPDDPRSGSIHHDDIFVEAALE